MKGKNTDLCVPDIGDSDSIELIKWFLSPGMKFNKEDEICELVTDKAAFNLEAPENGILIEQLVTEKSRVKVSQPLAKVEFFN